MHLEFIKPHKLEKFIKNIPHGPDEVCVLAGDIGNPYTQNYDAFMTFISENFKHTFVIPGNHEYYGNSIQNANEFMNDYFDKFDNISFLNNDYQQYNGYCFIGTTLWSHISNPDYCINDVYKIKNFDTSDYNKLNSECIAFLEETIQHHHNCIIITHHMPSESLIDEKYKTREMSHYNQWFYCDMDDFIAKNESKIKCWFYGHTHTPSEERIKGIPFLCNPIGYPNENKHLDFHKLYKL